MSIIGGVGDFFGLDIGTSALRMVQLKGSGPVKTLARYGMMPLDSKLAYSDARADQQKLATAIKDFLSQSGVSTKNVAVGLPSSKVFTTVVDIDRLAPSELAKTIQYQADALIPTPLAESKIDWALLGDSPKDRTKVEVLLSSVPNEFIEKRLDMLEGIGLNVIAFEPDSMAMTRSIVPIGQNAAEMVLDIGSRATDLVITMNGGARLTRSIPTGTESIVRSAVQNLNIEEQQAEQFVFKFGLSQDKLEGQIYNAIVGTVDLLIGEIEKSIKFFQTRYGGTKIERIIVTGGASTLPEFPLYVANKFGMAVEIGNAWRNIAFPPDKQNELLSVSNHFAVAAGLAERQE
ncbi:type IV pilus assembly protein PilM [Candidatus Saccharibacteria bacterium]|nr:type IV pilus assembly protein PilM [Candidatus Saccharibacteria bacterium]